MLLLSWHHLSKNTLESASFILGKWLEFQPVNILSVRYEIDVSVEWFLQNLDLICIEFYCLLGILLSIVWSRITFSLIFKIVGKREIGPKVLLSVLEHFLYRGLSLANLQSFEKRNNLIDKLQIWVTAFANLLTPSSRDSQ